MKYRIFPLLICLALSLSGCGRQEEEVTRQFFSMDTVMTITAYGPNGEEAVQAAQEAVNRLDGLLSRTDPDSQIREELSAALALVDSAQLEVDEDAPSARLLQAGMEVDLGAVAKGFAAGEAEEAMRAAGVERATIDLGGNVTVIGPRPDGNPWRIAVKDPQNTDSYLCVLSLEDVTLSTSGGYERYFEEDGVRYHHIIDPKTGRPADSGLLSVTVVTANHVLADALSTALFVAGEEDALDFWRSRDDIELVLCTDDGRIVVTEGLEDSFQLYDEDGGYTYEIARR